MFGFSLIRVKSCMRDRLDEPSVGISGRVYFVQSWTSSVVKFGMICCWITDFIRKNLIFLSDAPIDKLLCYRQIKEEMVWSNPLDDQSGYKRLHLCQIEYVFAQLMERNAKKWHATEAVSFWELLCPGKYLFAYLCCSVSSKVRMSSILSICCIAIS